MVVDIPISALIPNFHFFDFLLLTWLVTLIVSDITVSFICLDEEFSVITFFTTGSVTFKLRFLLELSMPETLTLVVGIVGAGVFLFSTVVR